MKNISLRFGISGLLALCLLFQGSSQGAEKTSSFLFNASETELGVRYFLSNGETRYSVYGFLGLGPFSRLTFQDMTTHSGEIFGRTIHSSGIFLQGIAGMGWSDDGRLGDEDFDYPFNTPYSKTLSSLKDGHLSYVQADIGYLIYRGPEVRAGAFVGYHFMHESTSAFGCTQVADDRICTSGDILPSTRVLSNQADWNALRLGLSLEWMPSPVWRLRGTAAYLPYVSLSGEDTHWLRTDFSGPIPYDGTGIGYQVDASLAYFITDSLMLEIGGRYWYLSTSGSLHFEEVTEAFAQPLKFQTNRFGGYVGVTYRF